MQDGENIPLLSIRPVGPGSREKVNGDGGIAVRGSEWHTDDKDPLRGCGRLKDDVVVSNIAAE